MKSGSNKVAIAALLAFAGFLGAILLLRQMPILSDKPAVFISLLFFPLLIYAVGSGAVSEISGPGGWGAKFQEIARQPVILSNEILPLQFVTKAEIGELKPQLDALDPKSPIAITLRVDLGDDFAADPVNQLQGRNRGYNEFDLAAYLRAFLEVDPELTIIYLDGEGRFQASSDALSVAQLEDADNHLHRYVKHLNTYNPTEIRRIVPLTTKHLREGQSNVDAIQSMNSDRVRSIVVVDEFSKPVGIVRRDVVVSQILEALVT